MPTNLYIEEITDEDFSNSSGVDAPQLTCQTSLLPPIPGVLAAAGSSATLLNSKNQLYLFGGCSRSGECSSALTCFDIDTSMWMELLPGDKSDSAPSKRFGASIAAHGTKLAVFGGGQPPSSSSSSSIFFNDLHFYDAETNRWSCVDPGSAKDESAEDYFGQTTRPMPRNSHTAVATSDGKMLLFGGANAEVGPMNDMWTLDLRSLKDEAGEHELQWEKIGGGVECSDNSSTPWPEAREMHSACIVPLSSSPSTKDDGLGMLVMGGRNADGSIRQDMWLFDLQTKRWRKLTDAARPRCSHTSVYLPK